jgi:hypothetical protein
VLDVGTLRAAASRGRGERGPRRAQGRVTLSWRCRGRCCGR